MPFQRNWKRVMRRERERVECYVVRIILLQPNQVSFHVVQIAVYKKRRKRQHRTPAAKGEKRK